jgi:hypothetical protein
MSQATGNQRYIPTNQDITSISRLLLFTDSIRILILTASILSWEMDLGLLMERWSINTPVVLQLLQVRFFWQRIFISAFQEE